MTIYAIETVTAMKRSIIFFLILVITTSVATGQENRTITGYGNNIDSPAWGSAQATLQYLTGNAFEDSISAPAGQDRPNPRIISNLVFDQPGFIESNAGISDFGWGFGQFIDHDITLVEDNLSNLLHISIPQCDTYFDPACDGDKRITMKRSVTDQATGTDVENPVKAVNAITSFADGSGVYGSENDRAAWLRTFEGGKLKMSAGGLLPFNTTTGEYAADVDHNAPFMIFEGIPPTRYYIAGDIRANEQPGLTSFHTLFAREHNRLCVELAAEYPGWSDEALYQRARKIVGALIQVVLYEEFLPAFGIELDNYTGYDDGTDASILNVFSAAAYRLGHTLVNNQVIRMTDDGEGLSFGSMHIKDVFFNPRVLTDQGGIEPIFIGMATQMQQNFDNKVVHTLRNFLFGPPGSGGLDLVSININRGRERGLKDFNSLRAEMGLAAHTDWSDITTNETLQASLESIYGDINKVDPWVGMLSEDIVPGAAVGQLVYMVLENQFTRLRDGDRFYYENDPAFTTDEVAELKSTLLSDIIRRNTEIVNIQDDVFHAQEHVMTAVQIHPFDHIRAIDIDAYPNPVNRFLNLSIRSMSNQSLTLSLMDVTGRVFMEEEVLVEQGDNTFIFDLDQRYTSGVYTIFIKSDEGEGSLKLVKR
ncbi:MAG: T9SS type A sorting domain-containing protein [Bacteroidetes bacterium]|nr:T9SS type A sorting domain-containing protein [Bacteroidota bacterium]